VAVVGCTNVNDIDVGVADDRPPIRARILPAELLTGRLNVLGRPSANRVQHHVGRQIEELGSLTPGIRMRLAHEVVTNHSDIERASSHSEKGKVLEFTKCLRACKQKTVVYRQRSSRPEMAQERIDELKEWFIMPERRGAYTAESPDRQND